MSSHTGGWWSHDPNFSLIWTGTEMIAWGGSSVAGFAPHYTITVRGDGARYDPATDTWSPIAAGGGPLPSGRPTAVWTGQQMLIWPDDQRATGWAYQPYWLTVQAPTQTYSVTMDPLTMAPPGGSLPRGRTRPWLGARAGGKRRSRVGGMDRARRSGSTHVLKLGLCQRWRLSQ